MTLSVFVMACHVHAGIIRRAAQHMFAHVQALRQQLKPGEAVAVRAHALELYNEELRDLSSKAALAMAAATAAAAGGDEPCAAGHWDGGGGSGGGSGSGGSTATSGGVRISERPCGNGRCTPEVRARTTWHAGLRHQGCWDRADASLPQRQRACCSCCPSSHACVYMHVFMNMIMQVVGVHTVEVGDVDGLLAFFSAAFANRAVAATRMNDRSSRSHAIYTVLLSRTLVDVSQGGDKVCARAACGPDACARAFHRACTRVRKHARTHPRTHAPTHTRSQVRTTCVDSRFHFVDLAGSERVKRSGVTGVAFREAVHINSGLLALGNVIVALSGGSGGGGGASSTAAAAAAAPDGAAANDAAAAPPCEPPAAGRPATGASSSGGGGGGGRPGRASPSKAPKHIPYRSAWLGRALLRCASAMPKRWPGDAPTHAMPHRASRTAPQGLQAHPAAAGQPGRQRAHGAGRVRLRVRGRL
jgi:hypothetical protein